MRNDGSAGEETKAEWYKTGRHNAMLAEVIKALPSVTPKAETVTEFADRCRECGARYGKYRKEAKRWKNKWLKSQKSGKWIKGKDDYGTNHFTCPFCGHDIATKAENWDDNYCANCGADLRGTE
jgi:hypothetical protein